MLPDLKGRKGRKDLKGRKDRKVLLGAQGAAGNRGETGRPGPRGRRGSAPRHRGFNGTKCNRPIPLEYLTEGEIERLMDGARANRWGPS